MTIDAPMLEPPRVRRRRLHPAWFVAAAAFVTLLGAAGFRSVPSVLIVPLETEFGWSRGVLSLAVSVNLVLFGLMAPFAAALMDRFGIRQVVAVALVLISAGSGFAVFVRSSWQLVLLWGVVVGIGTGSMALVFAATIANRWFVQRRGLVMGVLTAGSATGQLVFLPLLAAVTENGSWRLASVIAALAALAVVPVVLAFLRDHPRDRGVLPYGAIDAPVDGAVGAVVEGAVVGGAVVGGAAIEGAAADAPMSAGPTISPGARPRAGQPAVAGEVALPALPALPARGDPPAAAPGSVRRTLSALRNAARTRTFWALAGGFAICGASTNGLIGTHFVPAAHDHGLNEVVAASLLAVVGIFDIVGTIASGYLTDRFNPRVLLAIYYALRGVGLVMLPGMLGNSLHPSIIGFVIVYGLDWVATVPPTAALCREVFGASGTIVFGWVFASHQLGAALGSAVAGVLRDQTGSYTMAWFGAAGLCVVAAGMSIGIRRGTVVPATSEPALP